MAVWVRTAGAPVVHDVPEDATPAALATALVRAALDVLEATSLPEAVR
jgi:hypothetical protein